MNKIIRIFGYEFYVKELFVLFFTVLMMENIFSWLVFPNSVVLLAYEKVLSILIFGFVLYKFRDLTINEKIYIVVFTLLIIKLVFESMFNYGNFFEQLTMFSILFPVVFAVYVKYVCRSMQLDFLPFLAQFYLYLYCVFMLFYGWGFNFSLDSVDMVDYGPFSGDSRIIHARSIFMMIIPFLYYLNKFLKTRHWKSFIPFAFCFVVILIHQHRSVWSSCIAATVIFLFASYRNNKISSTGMFKIITGAAAIAIGAWVIMATISPTFTSFMADRFSEILNPNKANSTGEFREEQRLVYFQYFLQRPIFGWTFEGFDMPNPLVDWWPPKSGQHFHEGYMEMLFYHGIVGLVFKYALLFYLSVKAFSKRLSEEAIILVAFSISGLVFSFSYVLPLIFWGVVGVCLYYLGKEPTAEERATEPEDEELLEYDFSVDKRQTSTVV